MNPVLLSNLLVQLGTIGLPLIAKLMGDIKSNRNETTVTPEELLELDRLKKQTAEDIYARLGITPPPPTPVIPPTPVAEPVSGS